MYKGSSEVREIVLIGIKYNWINVFLIFETVLSQKKKIIKNGCQWTIKFNIAGIAGHIRIDDDDAQLERFGQQQPPSSPSSSECESEFYQCADNGENIRERYGAIAVLSQL